MELNFRGKLIFTQTWAKKTHKEVNLDFFENFSLLIVLKEMQKKFF